MSLPPSQPGTDVRSPRAFCPCPLIIGFVTGTITAQPRAWFRVACFPSLRGEQSGGASLLQSHKPHCVRPGRGGVGWGGESKQVPSRLAAGAIWLAQVARVIPAFGGSTGWVLEVVWSRTTVQLQKPGPIGPHPRARSAGKARLGTKKVRRFHFHPSKELAEKGNHGGS